jgi:hypothetical protein
MRASRMALLTRTRKARITALLFPKKTARISGSSASLVNRKQEIAVAA